MHFPESPSAWNLPVKIHGALDVFTFNDGHDLLKLLPDVPGQDAIIDVLRAANEDLFYPIPGVPGARANTTNEIAYADDDGEMQFLRRSLLAGAFKFDARGQQVLPLSMLKHFRQNLNFVTNLVCIGYSFGDVHINAVLREWLNSRRTGASKWSIRRFETFRRFSCILARRSLPRTVVRNQFLWMSSAREIERSRRERLEKRLEFVLRRLGKERAAQETAKFIKSHQDSVSNGLIAKLKQLPVVGGKPDFTALSDPKKPRSAGLGNWD